MFPDLDDYKTYPESNDCYLDGRYFDLIYQDYPGLIETQLTIRINSNGYESILDDFEFRNHEINILRVIIETDTSRHSGVVIIGIFDEVIQGYYFDNLGMIEEKISKIIETLLNIKIHPLVINHNDEKNPDCNKSGYCIAYCIKYVYDYLLDRDFDPSEIRRFASCVQSKFPPLDPEYADIEYGDGLVGGLLGAGLGGLAGGAIAGPGGFLVGGLLGGAGGYYLDRSMNNNRYYY
jgi:hypothetical protein